MNFLFELFNLHHHDALILCITQARLIIPITAMMLGLHILIIKPQKKQQVWLNTLALKLKIGATITTSNGLQGRVLCLLEHSIIIECTSGEKVEALKQSIVCINHEHA